MDLHLVQGPNNAKDQQQHRRHAHTAVPPRAQHALELQPMSLQHALQITMAQAAPALVQDLYKGQRDYAQLLKAQPTFSRDRTLMGKDSVK